MMTLDQMQKEAETLLARSASCQQRIGRMCSELKPPRMSVPPDAERDDDVYISDTLTRTDALIAAQSQALERMEKRIAILRGSLERYADPDWNSGYHSCDGTPSGDQGADAREALAATEPAK